MGINLELPRKLQAVLEMGHKGAAEIFRPISRKYDLNEHAYPVELDGLRLITWRGAARADQGLPFAREAALARKLGTDKGMQIGLDGVQLLGGHGFTKEHPV